MPYAVGIDLGTTNSVISVFNRGVPETIAIEGSSSVPSVISYRKDSTLLVGKSAKSSMLVNPESTVASAKRHMGDHTKTYQITGKSLSPANVASIVLKKLVEGACQTLGEDIRDVVITVPAYFNEAQREATKRAGELAGLNVLRLLPEPTAAALAYGLGKGKDQTIMVYDLGGGTFDISILEVKGNSFNTRAVGGNSQLGGDDFDNAIMTFANNAFKVQTGIDLLSMASNGSREARVACQRLKESAESAKIDLSQSDTATIDVPECLGRHLSIEITLAQYNSLIAPLLNQTIECMRSVLRDCKLTADDIDRVILVGGSTKNRAVRDLVAREIKEPYVADRVDEVVSHGAAILASSLFLPEEDNLPIEVTDVVAHSLGINAVGDNSELHFMPIISRQASYPCRLGRLGSTSVPFQECVNMTVYRGEEYDLLKNKKLGQLSLPVSDIREDLVPIGVIFEYDSNGIIHFTAVELPFDQIIIPILEYAEVHNGSLDLESVDLLIGRGIAKTLSVDIKPS